MVVGSIICLGFGLALILPQYRKHQTLVHARTAVEHGKEIAFALSKYRMPADFSPIELSFACERNEDNTLLTCGAYTFRLENGRLLHIEHQTLPQWFEIDIENGTIACDHEKDSWAGEHICAHAHVPATL